MGMCIHECLGINHLSALAFELLVICYCDVRVHVLLKNRITIELQSAECNWLQPAGIKPVAETTFDARLVLFDTPGTRLAK